jgi:hypothetical protein
MTRTPIFQIEGDTSDAFNAKMMQALGKILDAPKATEKQIRDHYKSGGYDVRISQGHVRFRPTNRSKRDTGAWLDGRWVEEYSVIDGKVVHK